MKTLHLALLLFLLPRVCLAAGENLVQNPGFEAAGDGGKPVAWEVQGRGNYTLDAAVAHTGKTALKWSNTDPGNLVRAMQWLPISYAPGKLYDFHVWVKTQNLQRAQGNGGGASIQLQWYDEKREKLLGWSTGLPRVTAANADWTQVGVDSVALPPQARAVRIVCFVFWGFTGTAWFDDVEVREVRPPLLSAFLCSPVYRGRITDDVPAIRALVRLNKADYGYQSARLILFSELRQANSPIRSRKQLAASDTCTIEFHTTGLAPGEYTLRLSLLDEKGTLLAREEFPLCRPAKDFAPRTFIDEHRRMIVDKKPFFPLGMYCGGMDEGSITRFADSPFNSLLIYGSPKKEMLDLIDRHGIKVIYSLNTFFAGERFAPKTLATAADEEQAIRERVRTFREHPALLAWYLNDELPSSYLPRLKEHYRWVAAEDPDHPAYGVLAVPLTIRQYAATADVLGSDPYPVPFDPASTAGAWAHETVGQLEGARPVWMVPQAMNWAHYYTDERKDQARAPSYPELRSMSWQCICEGATGLLYYTWEEMDKNPNLWNDLKRVAAEIKTASPMLLSPEKPPAVTVDGASWLHWSVRRMGGTTYLIVVNDGDGEGVFTAHFPRPLTGVTVQPDHRNITPTGSAFTDEVGKFEVWMYAVTMKQ